MVYVQYSSKEVTIHTALLWIAFLTNVTCFWGLDIGLAPMGPTNANGTRFWGWHFVFLTWISGNAQIGYFAFSLYYRYFGMYAKRESEFRAHMDRYFTLIFVVSFTVGLVFWSVLWPSPEIQASVARDGFWYQFGRNFGAHGSTWLFPILDGLLRFHEYKDWRVELGVIYAYEGLYLVWNIIVFEINDFFPYPYVFYSS